LKRHPIKKRQNVFSFEISKFLFAKLPYKKDVMQQKQFFENLVLLIVKNDLLVHFLESPKNWNDLLYNCIPALSFYFEKIKSQEILPNLIQKNKRCLCFTIIFSMYVSYCMFWFVDVKRCLWPFCLVINFFDEKWQPKKVTIGLFEAT